MLIAKPSSTQARDQRRPPERDDPRKQAAELIQRWLDDDSGHDERFWPILEEELRDSRLRCRE